MDFDNTTNLPSHEEAVALAAAEKRYLTTKRIRNEIHEKAGDAESLLGTTSDAAQLLLYGFTALVASLHTAKSLADVRAAVTPFAQLSQDFLAKVNSGEVQLPFMHKGLDGVVQDIEQRATSVSKALRGATSQ